MLRFAFFCLFIYLFHLFTKMVMANINRDINLFIYCIFNEGCGSSFIKVFPFYFHKLLFRSLPNPTFQLVIIFVPSHQEIFCVMIAAERKRS